MEKGSKKILIGIKEYLIITLGLLSYTLGWVVFLIPNNLVGGGVSGISAILFYSFDIPISYSFFVINLVLLAVALKVLGRGFGIKTIFAIIVASLLFEILPGLISQEFIDEISIANGKLLSSLIGGVCAGIGISMTFSQGGSTGGTDIIALMINKYRNVSPGKILLSIDVVIVAMSFFIPNEEISLGSRFATIMYGYILTFVVGYTVDIAIAGTKQSLQVFIFSKEYEKIADTITNEIGRGVTVIDAKGWYSKTDGKVLLVIVRKIEINQLYRMIKEIDRTSFLTVGSVMGVYGQGFDQIKK